MSNNEHFPTVAFKTLGCRLNQAETAHMAAQFLSAGYSVVDYHEAADIYVIHSCTITGNAERKSVQQARSIKKRRPDAVVIIAGCAVQTDRERIKTISGADLVADQEEKKDLPALIRANTSTLLRSDTPIPPYSDTLTPPPCFSKTRALVKVQDGCDFRCSYCIVPDARGAPLSRPAAAVLEEVAELVDNGYREIVLTGANLGLYHDGHTGLVDLLERIEQQTDIQRIRLSSIELTTAEKKIIDLMARSEKMCRYLHFPLQSGDDSVLSAMKRRYNTSEFRRTVDYALNKITLLGLGADIICGFPGETKEAHDNTLKLLRALPFSNMHVFPYSSRKGTPAASMKHQVPARTKKERTAEISALAAEKKAEFGNKCIGRPLRVLIEKIDTQDGTAFGWTGEYMEACVTENNLSVNQVVDFTPTYFKGSYLL